MFCPGGAAVQRAMALPVRTAVGDRGPGESGENSVRESNASASDDMVGPLLSVCVGHRLSPSHDGAPRLRRAEHSFFLESRADTNGVTIRMPNVALVHIPR